MSQIDAVFAELRQAGTARRSTMPFVTAGDPDLEFTAAYVRRLVAGGDWHVQIGGFPTAIRWPTGR